ncbi:MAG: hypothetical protein A2X34_00155 [Elusimicrobia bacterium GWC2_51_8]|nr:MAG: hypothetical protein A2X34_00155 [Elusimicrobia bacterium GWC2_51_8]OGR85840.1 MAG: hypothetical protein A2021_01730 [Elusimicrobia bacterium GWF2_52_66]
MDDKENKISKPAPPPLPGFLRPNSLQPPKQPPFGGPPLPGPLAQNARGPQFQGPAGAKADAGESVAARLKEEKDKLEKKVLEMEKLLSQEKERALLATLKNQQDETLSSKVESSLKDIQDRMRRDKRDQQVEEERITLKGKIKELEAGIVQERETWMHTLKGQMAERETQGRDVEGHFLYRLQEMERRWLDEKAQWQKEISTREDAIRSLKSDSERLRSVEDEFRRVSMEKSMSEKEISRLRDDVARADREKASIESYIKVIPEKERELAELKSAQAISRMREEKHLSEIENLQRELGGLSDKKNSEKAEELRALQTRHEALLQDKEKVIADISGDKIRTISELVKIKGFVSKVQAINAVLEKERGQLRLEKMQLAQNMAAQLEEIKKLRQEQELLKMSRQSEFEELSKKHNAALEKVKAEAGAELARRHEEEMSAYALKRQVEMDAKLSELRFRLEQSSAGEIQRVKIQLEADSAAQVRELKELASRFEGEKLRLETENRRLADGLKNFEKDAAGFKAQCEALSSQNAGFEEHIGAFEAERSKMEADLSAARGRLEAVASEKTAFEAELARLSGELKTESASRAGLESEMLSLNGRLQDMEKALSESEAALNAERGHSASLEAYSQAQQAGDAARIAELSAEIEKYKTADKSFGSRLKRVIKGVK